MCDLFLSERIRNKNYEMFNFYVFIKNKIIKNNSITSYFCLFLSFPC